MNARFLVVTAIALTLTVPRPSAAAPTGVQWTPDSNRLLVSKDVGNERWAITLNLSDFSASGNIYFTSGEAPGFVWCSKTGEDFDANVGELDLQYSCFGASSGFGGFTEGDWSLISDSVFLPLSFFIPPAETCDLSGALNGPSLASAGSVWNCGGSEGTFDFQVFANGTALSSATGAFDYDAASEGCRIAQLDDGSFLDLEYSPSLDHLTLYETTTDVKTLIVSECQRGDF